ncbi:MAG TPA: thiamine pyrophosphate-binding protein [Casimicrobiaceae bacterium]|nr:thiamine pyrophosphate-binding protein [Casimicrobiaceae bacterium]
MKHRGADALVRALSRHGVTRIFTVSGNHVMPVFDAVLDQRIALVHARHEAAAVHMADAYSRVSGNVGIALVTGGPGHANAVSALYTARMAEAPLVLISGHAPRAQAGMGAFQEMAQAQMAAPVAKGAWTCESADAISNDVARAIALACGGRPGPVNLNVPSDVLEAAVDEVNAAREDQTARETMPDAALAASIVERMVRATRPLVIVGPASMTRHGRALASTLEDAIGIPVVGMESPRGVADPSLGAFAEMLAQADCVLLVGKRLDYTLRLGKPPALSPTCAFVQVDADEDEFARTRRAVGTRLEAIARAAALAALEALARASLGKPHHQAWRDDVNAAIAYRPGAWENATSTTQGQLHPVEALRPLQTLLDAHADAVFVSDGGEFGQWAQACLHAPHRVINGMAGAIGPAIPYAIGARSALPDVPVVATLGDGTFGFHAAEIDTAVRYKLPFVAVIGNDARWNAEYQIQLRDYGRERLIGCDLLPTRYDLVASAFGGYGEIVVNSDEMAPALARAHASGLPACIDAMIEGQAAPNIVRQ